MKYDAKFAHYAHGYLKCTCLLQIYFCLTWSRLFEQFAEVKLADSSGCVKEKVPEGTATFIAVNATFS